MNLGAILAEVKSKLYLTDTSRDAEITGYINDTILDVVGLLNLPRYKGIASVATVLNQSYADLSTLSGGFSGVVLRVKYADANSSNNISVYSTLEQLMDMYPSMVEIGDVQAVVVEGTKLWYQPIPVASVNLTVLYLMNPPALSLSTDIPDYFPAQFHRRLIVYGATKLGWEVDEDGVEGPKVNTQYYEGEFQRGLYDFKVYLSKRRRNWVKADSDAAYAGADSSMLVSYPGLWTY